MLRCCETTSAGRAHAATPHAALRTAPRGVPKPPSRMQATLWPRHCNRRTEETNYRWAKKSVYSRLIKDLKLIVGPTLEIRQNSGTPQHNWHV